LLLTGLTFWLCTVLEISLWWNLVPVIIYLHLLVLGAINIQWNFYCRSINQLPDAKFIALTFDDGPASCTGTILDTLKNESVPAAFFCIGNRISGNEEIVKRIVTDGHLIGNHSFEHGFHFDWKSSAAMKEEIEQANKAIYDATGVACNYFRPPYGVTNPNLAKAIRLTGMKSVGWSLRSFDTTAKSEAALLKRVLSKLKGGDIVLFHDTVTITASILTAFIHEARKRGYNFARVDQFQ